MASPDLKAGSDWLEAGLHKSDDTDDRHLSSFTQNPYATAPQPEQNRPCKQRQGRSFIWRTILIFLTLYIVGFMVTSKTGFRFKSCMHLASPDAPDIGVDDEAVIADDAVDVFEAQDLTPDPPTEEVLVPPTLVILERRQEDGNSTSGISTSVIVPSTSTSAQESTSTSETPSSSSSSESTSSEEVSTSTSSSSEVSETTTSSQSSAQTTSHEESTTSAPTSSEQSSTEVRTSSSEIRHTYTTTLPGGEPTTITATTWVGVEPSSQISGDTEPELQNASPLLRAEMGVPLMVAMAIGCLFLA